MILSALYREGKEILAKAGLESPAFDSLCLLDAVLDIGGRAALIVRGGEEVSPEKAENFLSLCRERCGRPLQYILGKWEFDGMALSCGEGVLVPREDTLALVEAAQNALKNVKDPRILDLCAGTGAVGLALVNRIPDASCVCVELSDEAIPYLKENINTFGGGRVSFVKADVLSQPCFESGSFDAVVSNPPYIAAKTVDGLKGDVRKEPRMALDGGEDGLVFYRAITDKWKSVLKSGGVLAVEIGFDQAESVTEIFVRANLDKIGCFRDINGNNRTIIGTFNKTE